eukprot:scaffold30153_cov112-Isochrysis_galbana.AAC.2
MAAARVVESSPSSMSVTEMQPFSQTSPSSITTAVPRECSSIVHEAAGSAALAWAIMDCCNPLTVLAKREKLAFTAAQPGGRTTHSSSDQVIRKAQVRGRGPGAACMARPESPVHVKT